MPYRFEKVTLVVGPVGFDGGTGDGTGRYGFNGGACPQDEFSYSTVSLSVVFQQECNLIEWSGMFKVMHQLIASADPNTWSDAAIEGVKEVGTLISIRNPEYREPTRKWSHSARSQFKDEPALLRRILLQYRRMGGDDTTGSTWWMQTVRCRIPSALRRRPSTPKLRPQAFIPSIGARIKACRTDCMRCARERIASCQKVPLTRLWSAYGRQSSACCRPHTADEIRRADPGPGALLPWGQTRSAVH
jgi:hypothetical protein